MPGSADLLAVYCPGGCCCERAVFVVQEWFHFVDKEKQVRIRIDGKVNQMMAEAAELKQWTITEVRCCH